MIFAFASPITLTISSADASLIRFTLLNSFSRVFFVFSPIPFISSKAEATCRLLRLSRWKVMANLCTSSCICVSRRKRGEFCFSPMACGGKPYSSSDVGVSRLWQVRQWGCQGSARRQPLLRRSFALFRRR